MDEKLWLRIKELSGQLFTLVVDHREEIAAAMRADGSPYRPSHFVAGLGSLYEVAEKHAPASGFRCAFCGKGAGEVEMLLAGAIGVSICNECVEVCVAAIAEHRAEHGSTTATAEGGD